MLLIPRVLFLGTILATSSFPQFREHVVAEDLRGAYQVVAADVNRDGRLDLVGCSGEEGPRIWLQPSTWSVTGDGRSAEGASSADGDTGAAALVPRGSGTRTFPEAGTRE